MARLPLFPDDSPRIPDVQAGRDEMNFAEFPLVLLTDRVPIGLKGKQSIRYEYPHGALTVSGSDAYGLPTAADADVLVGLIQLTRKKNDFQDPKVHFTRYELLKVLRWPDEGKYYRRLDESLNRWSGVTLYYDNTWWDNRAKKHLTAKLHVIETVMIDDKATGRSQPQPFSYFVWNKTFIESCQADNLKRLDLDTYFGFRSAISKRMYRFLDKRFYTSPEWSFELREFAIDYIGMSRNYASNAGKIKEKLQPALTELEETGFIAPLPREERYTKQGRDWIIRIARPQPTFSPIEPEPPLPDPTDDPNHPLSRPLIDQGVTPRVAADLVRTVPADRIEAKLDLLQWLQEHKPGHVKEAGAWLVRAIRDDYAPPKGYRPKAARDLDDQAARQEQATLDDARRHAADARRRRQAEAEAIDAYWSGLSPDAQAALDAQALKAMPPEPGILRSPLKRSYLKTVREAHIRALLFGDPDTTD
ncbi:replication initiator protein A [Tautonia sp. JC769]|uniref:replication initiator protein A n=1 Tax=Tautonia sp. JC769 TaxID=3232135 RepID=UPI003457FB23